MDLNFVFNMFTDEQRSLVALMKEFCEREVDRKEMADRADAPISPNATKEQLMARIPWDVISKAHDVGLRQLVVPKEYGGGGYGGIGSWVTMAAVAEAAGYYGGEVSRLLSTPWMGLSSFTTAPKHLQDELCTNFMEDRKTMVAGSITEPNHGSDYLTGYDAPGYGTGKVTAVPDGDYWVINGEKMFCTAGAVSNYINVFVRTAKEGHITESMTQFLVPTNTPGWSILRVNDMLGGEMAVNVQMRFDNCRIHKRYMVTPLNKAFMFLRSGLAGKSIHWMGAIGYTRRIWEDMRDFAKSRIQGGKPIIEHPNVGQLVAEADVLIRAARLLQYQFAWECDQETPGSLVNPLGFYYTAYYYKAMAERLVSIGLEVYGGMAPQRDLPFERWLRYNLGMNHGGSNGSLNLIKASHLL
jgi:alkylation response protein AidB-like acyl-CoA dehydrogenase